MGQVPTKKCFSRFAGPLSKKKVPIFQNKYISCLTVSEV